MFSHEILLNIFFPIWGVICCNIIMKVYYDTNVGNPISMELTTVVIVCQANLLPTIP